MPCRSFQFQRREIISKNRVVLAAMTNKQSHDDGTLSGDEITWLLRRAQGGFGIITTAASHVHPNGKSWEGEMGVWGDHQIPGLSELAGGIRKHGALGLVQIFHGGMRSPRELTGQKPVSSSENSGKGMTETSRELSDSEIVDIVKNFRDAARRSERAGFDGIEIHAAHGYLICQFLGTKTNRRTDKWGGDLRGRSRLLRRIIESIREETSEEFLISIRISPEIGEIGILLNDSLELALMLSKLEIDLLHISCWDSFSGSEVDTSDPRTITRRFREEVPDNLPIISTGSIWSSQDASFVLDEGADFIGVARAGIAFPDWAAEVCDGGYNPPRPPFSPDHLLDSKLSPQFIEYMRRWKGFVTDDRKKT